MRKSDHSIRSITVARILRRLMKDADLVLSAVYHEDCMENLPWRLPVIEGELPIASTSLSDGRFTLVTSRRVITFDGGDTFEVLIGEIKQFDFFMNFKKTDFPGDFATVSIVKQDDSRMPVFMETGKPSMVIIQAIRVVCGLYS